MLYKFDILFKKELRGGGVKVVTYRQLLHGGRCRVGAHPAARRAGAGACRLQGGDPERPLPGQKH